MAIQCSEFFEILKNLKIDFFSGVPDSLLKNVCEYINTNVENESHVITANEGQAVAMAAGYHLATGGIPLVYLQNSGIGNTVNPLASLADREVYSIPMVMLIGWRGEPGVKDEPQHIKQGRITPDLMDVLEIPYEVIEGEREDLEKIERIVDLAAKESCPVALVVKKGSFSEYKSEKNDEAISSLVREQALSSIINFLDKDDTFFFSTTGHISRELFEIRERSTVPKVDFLNVGSMGHISMIAYGFATQKKNKKICILDGDGSLLMHMGALPILGQSGLDNIIHIVLNNAAHGSVGGQPTVAQNIDLCAIAKSSGYKWAKKVLTDAELKNALKDMEDLKGPLFLDVYVGKKARKDLARPNKSPLENKKNFMEQFHCEKANRD